MSSCGVLPGGIACARAGGEWIGRLVNSRSNWDVSNDPTTVGCQGGGAVPSNRASQSTLAKNVCARISSASPGPEPSRLAGSRSSNARKIAFASGDKCPG